MALHSVSEQDGGLAGWNGVRNFGRLPPETGLRDSLVRLQRSEEASWVGDYVNELGQDLGCESQRDLRRKDLTLEKFVGRLARRQLDQLQLDQKGGINTDYGSWRTR